MKGGIGWRRIDFDIIASHFTSDATDRSKIGSVISLYLLSFFREHSLSLKKRLYYLLCDGELVSSNSWLHHISWFLGFWFFNIVSWSFQSGFSESLEKRFCQLQCYPKSMRFVLSVFLYSWFPATVILFLTLYCPFSYIPGSLPL